MKIVAIGAHPDDMEFGAGGTLAKHIASGDTVHGVLCTLGGVSGDPAARREEAYDAAAILGIDELAILDYPIMKLNMPSAEFAQEIRKVLLESKPDRVYTHTNLDYHQVHYSVNRAVMNTSKKLGIPDILEFEILSSTTTEFRPGVFVDISAFVDKKIKSLQAHKSQASSRFYLQPNVIKSMANMRYVWGKVGSDPLGMAEGFKAHRLSLKSVVN